ncbi:N-6 DNA methylase [Micromonospora sp. HM5-17]|uniref:N-6 DNA methylase n=1 Tax=Micromonospora sp. HM5-17 TaxID=2487710 RepID=UPI000F46A116|nr:N-6 DNA methylase [Micromonospora sp. HM5-17]ROT27224.1 hypothetical protein EF879_23520 [Micromonospora sp. HM5-17]
MTTKTARRKAVPESPRQHAWKIAEAVDEAWHGNFGGSRIEIPVSVVAALALVEQRDPDGPDLAEQMLSLDRHGFVELLRSIWNRFAIGRPDLLPRTKPLWGWLDDDDLDDQLLRSVHATGQAALKKGQLELTGVRWRREEVDLLGSVLQAIRSRSARDGLGQFLTPVDVTDMMGEIVVADLGIAAYEVANDRLPLSVLEPCAGTGTMLLGAARAIRRRGGDPEAVEWWANDIDWLAAACCAVNVHCWGLGMRVVVGCGDGLMNDWMQAALDERQRAIDEVARLWEQARMLAAVRQLFGLDAPEEPLVRHLRESLPPEPKAAPPHSATFDADATYRQGRLF